MEVREDEVYAFILENIDTVPHLEALLQIWNSRPQTWSDSEIAARLYLDAGAARTIMADLARRGLIARIPQPGDCYCYSSSPAHDRMLDALARVYQADLIRVSNAIHSKASAGVREFARAFRFMRKRRKS